MTKYLLHIDVANVIEKIIIEKIGFDLMRDNAEGNC